MSDLQKCVIVSRDATPRGSLLSQLWHNSVSPLLPQPELAAHPSPCLLSLTHQGRSAPPPSPSILTWRSQVCCTALNCCSDCYLDGRLAGWLIRLPALLLAPQLYFLPLEGSISVLMLWKVHLKAYNTFSLRWVFQNQERISPRVVQCTKGFEIFLTPFGYFQNTILLTRVQHG